MGRGAFAEEAALDVHHAGDHFMPGFLVLGKFSDKGQDLRSIAGHGGANLDGHGRALGKFKGHILRRFDGRLQCN